MAWGQVYFRVRGAENSDHIDAARQAALAFVAGHKVADIVALCEEIYDETMAHRIWEGTRELAQQHLEAGQRVWLVTATPVELASIIARRLGLTGALGTVAESVDGVYTGRLVGGLLHGEAKAAAVEALAAREGLDLARCSAYSDSTNDLPMLRLVGHPAAVNPDADLRAEAKASELAGARLPGRPQGHHDRPAHRGWRGRGRRRHRGRPRPAPPSRPPLGPLTFAVITKDRTLRRPPCRLTWARPGRECACLRRDQPKAGPRSVSRSSSLRWMVPRIRPLRSATTAGSFSLPRS